MGFGPPPLLRTGAEPGGSATIWLIDAGRIAGIDVSGLVVVNLAGPAEAGSSRPERVVGLIDERATPEQMWALVDMFRGNLGSGPECFTGRASVERTYQVPVEHRATEGLWTFSVPGRLTAVLPVPGPVWSRTPRWEGKAAQLSVVMPEEAWAFRFEDCEASHAWFVTRSPMGRPSTGREQP